MKRQKKDVWKRREKRKVKRCIIQSKKKVKKQFRRKINEDCHSYLKPLKGGSPFVAELTT